jgi:hypothetical protein
MYLRVLPRPRQLLVKDANSRLSLDAMEQQPWIRDHCGSMI